MPRKMPTISRTQVNCDSVDYEGDDGEETLVMTDWPSSSGWDVTIMQPDRADIHFSVTRAQFAAMTMIAAAGEFHLPQGDD